MHCADRAGIQESSKGGDVGWTSSSRLPGLLQLQKCSIRVMVLIDCVADCKLRQFTYRATSGTQLQADLDHVNGLNDACGTHAAQTSIEIRLDSLPDFVVCHC